MWAVFTGILLASTTGCQSLLRPEISDDSYRELTDTTSIMGPMGRAVQASLQRRTQQQAVASPEIAQALDSANKLFENRQYAKALPLYKKLARDQKLTAFGEEAQFKLAESHYQLQNFAEAQDAFDQLLEDYPSTRHVDQVARRLFTVAQAWLGQSVPLESASGETNSGGVQLASHEELTEPAKLNINTDDPTFKVPILPNFHDPRRPLFDTQGRALEALKSIWINDPLGPLADDALMMTATHYLKKKNYVEADRYFGELRTQYRDSPHLEKAFVLGSHAKLMSYRGSMYEGNTLAEAKRLKESTLRLFPENSQRTELREELQGIYDEEARRLWARIEFRQRKGQPRAVAIACRTLIESYPDTEWAQKAQQVLNEIPRDQIGDLPGF